LQRMGWRLPGVVGGIGVSDSRAISAADLGHKAAGGPEICWIGWPGGYGIRVCVQWCWDSPGVPSKTPFVLGGNRPRLVQNLN
jgi:hypothetical protein